jgi:cytochrome c-type biogenesis protein CcsB
LLVTAVPVTSFSEGLSLLGWLTAGAFLILQSSSKVKAVGAVIGPLVFGLTVGALLVYEPTRSVSKLAYDPWLGMHVTLALLGNAMFALASSVSVIYLVQESLLKSRRRGSMMLRLPALEKLDRLNFRCLTWGFPLLTLGMLTGGLAGLYTRGRFWSWEPLEVVSMISWLLYAALLQFRLTAGLRGRRAATLTIVGFCVLVLSYFSVNVLPLPGHHGGGLGS